MFWKINKEFAEAYNNYYPIVFSAVYTRVGNYDDAEDICQEVFLKLHKKIESVENIRKWLLGALRLEVLSFYKKKKPDAVDPDILFQDMSLTFVNGFRDIRIIIDETIDDMDNFKDSTDKALFDLVAIYNFTYEEAGAQLGFSKRQVRYKYGKIVERLLDSLNKKGIKNLEDLL